MKTEKRDQGSKTTLAVVVDCDPGGLRRMASALESRPRTSGRTKKTNSCAVYRTFFRSFDVETDPSSIKSILGDSFRWNRNWNWKYPCRRMIEIILMRKSVCSGCTLSILVSSDFFNAFDQHVHCRSYGTARLLRPSTFKCLLFGLDSEHVNDKTTLFEKRIHTHFEKWKFRCTNIK